MTAMTSSAVTAPAQQAAGHAVSGGGIEAVAGEEGPGRALRHDAAVEEQGAAMGAAGAELHVVTDHEHRDAARWQGAWRMSASSCLNSASRPLVGSSSSNISGVQQQHLGTVRRAAALRRRGRRGGGPAGATGGRGPRACSSRFSRRAVSSFLAVRMPRTDPPRTVFFTNSAWGF